MYEVVRFTVLIAGVVVLSALLAFDLGVRRLPNSLVSAYFFLYFIFVVILDTSWSQLGLHVLISVLTFIITSIFFALRWMGGGDVKLWTAVMLWAGPQLALPVVIITTFAGAILGVLGWLAAWRLRCAPHTFGRSVLRLISSDRGVPYGVALAIAGLFVIYAYSQPLMWLN